MSDLVLAWEALFGVYAPVEITDIAGNVSYMTDWGYVARVAFFIIVVYCILKLLGGALRSDRR